MKKCDDIIDIETLHLLQIILKVKLMIKNFNSFNYLAIEMHFTGTVQIRTKFHETGKGLGQDYILF